MSILREPISSITHLIAGGLSVVALVLLISKQLILGNVNEMLFISSIIFGVSLILLYFTSGIYHAISATKEKTVKMMKKLDHSMIYILIAGSYSPFCLYVLPKKVGIPVFTILWIIALVGITLKILWINMPRVLSTALYIGMGWVALFVIKDLYANLVPQAFFLLVLGGVLYTIGGVIYAIKKPNFKNWNFHDIFHIFTMLGSLSHFLLVFIYLI
ncbi:hemolysin III family protein [Peptostreptococcus russellii]|uniref:Hemolysin III n=1 Tax=Peptostreptococcus russellii TaxID=215200 RepID=A0A1H8JDZ8_9FIRM|nr:hemolysin III family protein [Peptostreptococcus russellii]MBC2578110.1 hemolysin III family protein [Peptostreptococcus russellii]SEN78831.1 hemolysin III [Peptostreptococcus russellii]